MSAQGTDGSRPRKPRREVLAARRPPSACSSPGLSYRCTRCASQPASAPGRSVGKISVAEQPSAAASCVSRLKSLLALQIHRRSRVLKSAPARLPPTWRHHLLWDSRQGSKCTACALCKHWRQIELIVCYTISTVHWTSRFHRLSRVPPAVRAGERKATGVRSSGKADPRLRGVEARGRSP